MQLDPDQFLYDHGDFNESKLATSNEHSDRPLVVILWLI
jgi:hypothetical protein